MKKTGLAVVLLLSVAVFAAPVSAAPTEDLLLTDIGTGQYGGNTVAGSCQAGPGASLDLNYVTYVVRGTATSASSHGAVPVGTSVACWIRDTVTGAVYGPKVTGGAPGGAAVAAGVITAYSSGHLAMCTEAYAIFNDGLPPAHYKTAGC